MDVGELEIRQGPPIAVAAELESIAGLEDRAARHAAVDTHAPARSERDLSELGTSEGDPYGSRSQIPVLEVQDDRHRFPIEARHIRQRDGNRAA